MANPINALAAEAAASYRDGRAYTYAAPDALSARILFVEEGGGAFPDGEGIGSPLDVSSHISWSGIFERAEYLPGMYSWWNAVPCGLDRPNTADDLGRGGKSCPAPSAYTPTFRSSSPWARQPARLRKRPRRS